MNEDELDQTKQYGIHEWSQSCKLCQRGGGRERGYFGEGGVRFWL